MTSRLDQLVKGAPAVDAQAPAESLAPLPKSYLQGSSAASESRPSTPDPLSTLPSSPPQIYLNLLILECSLRAQYLALRERRRQNTFFLTLLALWIAYFFYALFLRPREDGRGVGGSVYWMVEMGEKVALMGGIVTGILVWGTGQWERGVRWPRRWLTVANRGLRAMNTKIVVIRGPWWQELLSYLSFIFPWQSLFHSPNNYHYVELSPSERRANRQHHSVYEDDSEAGVIEEDLSPGGDYIRLLLLPKAFSAEFRENWDEYRADYWEKENERRAQLRKKIYERERQLARQEGGWFWWLPFRRSRRRKIRLGDSHHQGSSGKNQDGKSRRSTRSNSHSHHSRASSSRGSTPVDGGSLAPPDQQQGHQRRKKASRSSTSSRGQSPLTAAPQVRESTPSSVSSTASDDSSSLGGNEKRATPEATTIEST
ncbi:hypothetical protein VTN96DRAFT_7584 [Rasamsonia emersonii]|uniref:Spo7-like protein n=1 Tax=Rasamsonia emersonii (strain ATCC 16479 / CBS 393.64 / IMI 116815) TaxID=1408163 RepID=A0A0F4YLG9_RASE3|nr:Spo7-like protein [Rasamsonia emersonii CBS 393.64]KKA18691.1 Spo7-like protein [Rasamsonia emersonii CBS 393.64]